MKSVFYPVCVFLFIFSSNAQDSLISSNESFIVREILDANGLKDLPIDSVALFENGKVTQLNLNNRDIERKGIQIIPASIGKLEHLAVISLNDNDLRQLPNEFCYCTSLVKIEIKNNSLTSLPNTIGMLKNLKELDVRNNELDSLPAEIGLCASLWKVQLWGNNLVTLPATLLQIKPLLELYLNNNRFVELPPFMTQLKLRYLDIQDNRLCHLAPDMDLWVKKFEPRYKSWQKCN